ncbi:50S ribosomal protein L29 [Candidatus Peregrinibacteria bacterium]|nr:50S ribosomal protein L29 [Candidatus Peregrinibacteria bacterium]
MLSIQELHTSTVKELQLELENARLELFRIHMGTKTKHLKDTSLIPKHKRYIAQVLTMLRQTQNDKKVSVASDEKLSGEASESRIEAKEEKKTKKVKTATKITKKTIAKKK